MANTTNYNWETPDDTDLVKDGAAAIRTLGSSIDTTTKNLNPQTTTGALAYRSATANVNTALPIGTAGQVLRVNSGATAPEWATPADQTPLTTKGDLFGFDTADARIPIGTNGHILTADSTQALGLKWAAPAAGGGITQLASGSFSAAVTISSIDQTYNFLLLYFDYANAAANALIRVNGQTGSIYDFCRLSFASTTVTASTGQTGWSIGGTGSGSSDNAYLVFPDYANSGRSKAVNWTAASNTSSSDGGGGWGKIRSGTAISSITITAASGSFSGNYNLYGVK